MCHECGCGLGGAEATPELRSGGGIHPGPAHAHGHPHDHPHQHAHAHAHAHAGSSAEGAGGTQWIQVRDSLLARNDRLAERNRGFFQAKGLLVINVLGSPGAGKTALIERTGPMLRPLRTGVIVGDLATDNDARRIRAAGMPVVQISTGTMCHLEADMVARALPELNPDALDVLIIENVGNLVCPAAYDLGEHLRVVLLSVAEGEDKPLKYPPMFHSANVALLTKVDLAEVLGFDRRTALRNLSTVGHHARVMEVSSRTGAGMDAWVAHLRSLHASARA